MNDKDYDSRLRRLGKDRRWLAEKTGYSWNSLRDCLAPGSKKGISEKMARRLDAALIEAEAHVQPAGDDFLAWFEPKERREIAEHAAREGYGGPHAWLVEKIKAVLAVMRTVKRK